MAVNQKLQAYYDYFVDSEDLESGLINSQKNIPVMLVI